MNKKMIAALLAMACLWGNSFPAMAAAYPNASGGIIIYHDVDGAADITPDGNEIVFFADPRFKYFDTLSSGMSLSGNKATCTGTVAVDPQYDTKLTLTLERSSDGKKWEKVKTWSGEFVTGKERVVLTKSYYLTRGYSYRLITKVTVDAGSSIETAECESNHIEY